MNSEVAASDDEQLTDNVPGTRLSFQEEFVILDEESVGDLDVSLDDIFATDPTNQVKMKSRAPPGNAEDMLRASEFEKGSLTPDSPFSGLHLGNCCILKSSCLFPFNALKIIHLFRE